MICFMILFKERVPFVNYSHQLTNIITWELVTKAYYKTLLEVMLFLDSDNLSSQNLIREKLQA